MNDIETRAATVADVNFPKRIVEVIVAPYEQETTINESDRSYIEVVSRGAYDGVEVRKDIKVNLDHRRDQLPVGRAVALHPSRDEGLVAEIYMSRSSVGEDALYAASEGLVGASAGFQLLRQNGGKGRVVPNAEVWETRTRRRLNHLYLHHIAMTGEPAYPGATVLDVRTVTEPAPPPALMPNRDRLEVMRLLDLADEIDKRYSLFR